MKHGSKIIHTPFWDGWVGPWLTKKSFGAIFWRKFATSTSQHEVEAQDWWQCPWLRTWMSFVTHWLNGIPSQPHSFLSSRDGLRPRRVALWKSFRSCRRIFLQTACPHWGILTYSYGKC
jgi:hypothetical protein